MVLHKLVAWMRSEARHTSGQGRIARWIGSNWARLTYARRIEPTWLELNHHHIPIADLPNLPTPQADQIFGPLVLTDDDHVHQLKFVYDEQLRLIQWGQAGAPT